jgi:bacteriorhodopsin
MTSLPFFINNHAEKKEKKENPTKYYVKASFLITYICLLTTGTITFIEALRTQNPMIRHIMNLETCISIVAGYFYSTFVAAIDDAKNANKPIEWSEITQTRYVDWAITTPMMLLTLCIFLSMHSKVPIRIATMASILLSNYLMLYVGYLGEVRTLSRITATFIGFLALIFIFAIFYFNFVSHCSHGACSVFFSVYVIIWSIYGIAYHFSEEYKNIAMNILDCVAKCFVGLGLWLYYTKIIRP